MSLLEAPEAISFRSYQQEKQEKNRAPIHCGRQRNPRRANGECPDAKRAG